jgi:hypothetical protein
MKCLPAILCGWLVYSSTAFAVPLFGESAGSIQNGILTLYKDSSDPKKVYFFPNSTKFSTDNSKVPLFNFVYWGLGKSNNEPSPAAQPPGGYMSLTTHLVSDESQQAALTQYMKTHPQMDVAVLPIKSSIVGLSTTAKDQAPLSLLFSEFNFAKVGGRAEDEIGVNAVLTPVGAKAFKSLLSKDKAGSPIKFDYCYKIQGFGPNIDASIEVYMDRVYDYFAASHSGGWGFFGWQIRAAVEKLQQQNSIRIDMKGGDAKQWEVLQKVADSITQRLFTPELGATPATAAEGNRLFNFGLSSVHKDELKREVWTWRRQDLEEREFCTAVDVRDLSGYLDKLVTNSDY